jgi:hypothetical protein
MEKPPSKEEILLDWFLGDSKEILAELKSAVADAAELRTSIKDAGTALGAHVDEARQELIAANRALVSASRDAEAKQRTVIEQLDARSRAAFAGMVRRCVLFAGCAACAGGILGAVVAALLLR